MPPYQLSLRYVNGEPDHWHIISSTHLIFHERTITLLKNNRVEDLLRRLIPSGPVHYISHHQVSKTTPIRIVYDCSCRLSHNHPSINDCLRLGHP